MMQHLDDGLIHELVDGEVPSDQLGPVQRHLDDCAACRARLDAARALASGVDELIEALEGPDAPLTDSPVLPLPVHRPAPRWGRTLGLAASLAVAAGLGYGARDLIPPPGDGRTPAPVATPAPVVGAPDDVVVATDPPAREGGSVASSPTPATPAPVKPTPEPTEAPAQIATRDRVEARQPDLAAVGIEPRVEAVRPMAAEAARAAAPAPGAGRAQLGIREQVGTRDVVMVPRENSLVPRDAASASAKQMAPPVAVEFGEAMALLGGRLRLVEGLVPSRLERIGDEVRVIYPVPEGILVLSQQRVGDELRWRLTGPPGFPADSLEVLRRRVAP